MKNTILLLCLALATALAFAAVVLWGMGSFQAVGPDRLPVNVLTPLIGAPRSDLRFA